MSSSPDHATGRSTQTPDTTSVEAGHEMTDVRIRPIAWLAGGTLIAILVGQVGLWALLHVLTDVAKENDPPLPPLAEQKLQPPEPRLQSTPNEDYARFRAAQDQHLGSYGWVNQQEGVVHIPIARAMELLPQRLDAAPASADQQPTPSPTDSTAAPRPPPPAAPPPPEAGEDPSTSPELQKDVARPDGEPSFPRRDEPANERSQPPARQEPQTESAHSPPTDQTTVDSRLDRPGIASRPSSMISDVGLDQKLGDQVPLDLVFRDEQGKAVRLSQYVNGERPAILALVYYQCPMLCTEVLNGLLKSAQAVPFELGTDYDIVTVSIDPRETPEMAAAKKARYASRYRREGAEAGWHFLTGDAAAIDELARTVGFRYRYDPASGQFAHASGIMVLTPQGQLSRYFYGIDYDPRDLRLGLVESSRNEIGSAVDQILLLCFHYDPRTGKYGLVISNALRLAGSATVIVLAGFLFVMFRQERRRPEVASDRMHPSEAS